MRALILAVILFALVVVPVSAAGPGQMATCDQTITAQRGDLVSVSVEGNSSAGYAWRLVGSPGCLKLARHTSTRLGNNACLGCGTLETWVFRAAKAGKGTVTLECKRSWEKKVARVYRAEVRVK